MFSTKDIYYKVDHQIVPKGFWSLDLNGQKQLIEQELINYTLEKLRLLGITIADKDNMSLLDLLGLMDDRLITREEKEEVFRHYTHYLLNVASSLQNYQVTWWSQEDQALINNPICGIDNGLWDTVVTCLYNYPLDDTKFVLDIFQSRFGIVEDKEPKKLLDDK